MKKAIILAIVISILVFGYKSFKVALRTNLALNSAVAGVTDKVGDAVKNGKDVFNNVRKAAVRSLGNLSDIFAGKISRKDDDEQIATFVLKHGGVITGKVLTRTGKDYTVEWKGEKIIVAAGQIKQIERKAQKDALWPYKNDVAIKRTNGVVVDGKISEAAPEEIKLLFYEGGGELEMIIKRRDVDYLIFAPVHNGESRRIENRLKEQFPRMKFYPEGNFTLVTDSYITSVNQYRKALRSVYTEIYLKFFRLFNGRSPQNQNFVVVFDDFNDYVEYAATDGVPGWLAIGYFSPTDRTLYIFNAFGERLEKIIFEIVAAQTGRFNASVIDPTKNQIDQRYHIFIEGMGKEITDKIWDGYNLYKSELREMTFSTLRHEFTHELFNNWGLQSIVLSRPNKAVGDRITKKKKEFLDTEDPAKKKELFMTLMKLQEQEMEGLEMEAAGSWLSEGMATYCETDPVGSVDESWLFTYQEMVRKNEVNPLEFLANFKMGSFPGLCSKAMLNSYAESWAFTTFLMNKYPDQFIEYQRKVSELARTRRQVGKESDDLKLLLQILKKDLPSLEKEFKDYMASYKEAEDPSVKRFMRYHKIEEDLLQSTAIGRYMSTKSLQDE